MEVREMKKKKAIIRKYSPIFTTHSQTCDPAFSFKRCYKSWFFFHWFTKLIDINSTRTCTRYHEVFEESNSPYSIIPIYLPYFLTIFDSVCWNFSICFTKTKYFFLEQNAFIYIIINYCILWCVHIKYFICRFSFTICLLCKYFLTKNTQLLEKMDFWTISSFKLSGHKVFKEFNNLIMKHHICF